MPLYIEPAPLQYLHISKQRAALCTLFLSSSCFASYPNALFFSCLQQSAGLNVYHLATGNINILYGTIHNNRGFERCLDCMCFAFQVSRGRIYRTSELIFGFPSHHPVPTAFVPALRIRVRFDQVGV